MTAASTPRARAVETMAIAMAKYNRIATWEQELDQWRDAAEVAYDALSEAGYEVTRLKQMVWSSVGPDLYRKLEPQEEEA